MNYAHPGHAKCGRLAEPQDLHFVKAAGFRAWCARRLFLFDLLVLTFGLAID